MERFGEGLYPRMKLITVREEEHEEAGDEMKESQIHVCKIL